MGAQLWHHFGPWRDDPAASLIEVQVAHLRSTFDYSAQLAEHLWSAREAFRLTEADDPYSLFEDYRADVARFEMLATLPPPATAVEEIERLRMLHASSGEGIGCVLDVTHVSAAGGMPVARSLPIADVIQLCGTARPTVAVASTSISRINKELGRGDSMCFPVYNEDGQPEAWFFVGNTID